MSRLSTFTSAGALVLAALCAVPALSLIALLGTGFGEITFAEVFWVLGAFVLGVAVVSGLVLRMQRKHPRRATALLVIGAPAPAVAWFWFPPLYALSLLLIILALVSHDRSDPDRVLAPT